MCCHVREGGAAMNRLLYEGGGTRINVLPCEGDMKRAAVGGEGVNTLPCEGVWYPFKKILLILCDPLHLFCSSCTQR